MARRVNWDESPINEFKQSVLANIVAATGGEYRVRDNASGPQALDVIVLGDGWSPPGVGTQAEYRLKIMCLYAQILEGSEKGAEEMARRVWCGLAYLQDTHRPDFDPVPGPQIITFGTEPDTISFAGVQFTIRHGLTLLAEDES